MQFPIFLHSNELLFNFNLLESCIHELSWLSVGEYYFYPKSANQVVSGKHFKFSHWLINNTLPVSLIHLHDGAVPSLHPCKYQVCGWLIEFGWNPLDLQIILDNLTHLDTLVRMHLTPPKQKYPKQWIIELQFTSHHLRCTSVSDWQIRLSRKLHLSRWSSRRYHTCFLG